MLAQALLELGMPDISVDIDSIGEMGGLRVLLYLSAFMAAFTVISTLVSAHFICANYIIREPKKIVWLSALFTFISNIPVFAIILLLSFVSNGLGGGDMYQFLAGAAFLTLPIWATLIPFLVTSLIVIKPNSGKRLTNDVTPVAGANQRHHMSVSANGHDPYVNTD